MWTRYSRGLHLQEIGVLTHVLPATFGCGRQGVLKRQQTINTQVCPNIQHLNEARCELGQPIHTGLQGPSGSTDRQSDLPTSHDNDLSAGPPLQMRTPLGPWRPRRTTAATIQKLQSFRIAGSARPLRGSWDHHWPSSRAMQILTTCQYSLDTMHSDTVGPSAGER